MTERLPPLLLLLAVLGLVMPLACSSKSSARPDQAAAASQATTVSTSEPAPAMLHLQVLERRPHDTSAFTEGLETVGGRLFESTGLQGASSLRELDPRTGQVIREHKLSSDLFGEGLAAVDGKLVQLTWRDGIAFVWDPNTFAEVRRFSYKGEGWGLCYDAPGHRLVQSDGSDQLTFRDPDTFAVLSKVSVRRQGEPLDQLNELECTADGVWANVWHSNNIVRIDPANGRVTGVVDAKELVPPHPGSEDVLNGIARQDDGTWLVTGKRWPTMYVVRFNP